MDNQERAMLEIALANSIAAKSLLQTLLTALSATGEPTHSLIVAAIRSSETSLDMEVLANADSPAAPAIARARDEVQRFRRAIERQ